MKKLLINKKWLGFIITAIALVTFASCSKKIDFLSSRVVPAAVGSVTIKSDKNNNHTIEINVRNLAPASQLTPPKKIYVVWIKTAENESINIGQLKSGGSFFSKALKASLNAVSSSTPTSVFISAEDEGNVTFPGLVVLSTK